MDQEKKLYSKVDTSMNFAAREQQVIDFWNKENVFEDSVKEHEGGEEFSFYDGPPTANGKPHIGHILTRVMKDIIPRYQTMKGKHVLRKAGWDTHGLPVELEVEKLLGMDGKQDIEKYGIEPGYWADMENPYVTYDDKYIESVWWALKEIWKKGLLYKGHKIVPYCPRCGTALSSHEVAQGYKDVKETSVFVRFHRKGMENCYFLAWTTTPWTLPSNVALCMNADEDYAEIETEDGARYVLAQALIPLLFEEGSYKILSVKKGREYEYAEYEPLFDYAEGSYREKAHYVVCDGYVTLTDGTGIVHIAPAFGEDDYRVGKKYELPVVNMVDERGCFKPAVTDFAGTFVKKADKGIIELLKQKGLLFKEMLYEHSYPHCWRCDTPLLYYARESWFIKVTAVKDELIKANNSVNWMPETIKTGRMGNFLENVIDWGLSRDRYWGTPLPVWVCEKCGKVHVIGSKAELKEKCGIEGDIELHRPYIDNCTFGCECGGTMKRTPEVIDCWFDSGSMPFAQYHYPFENKDLFDETFPADFISEAVDQTRGWFYTLLVISTILFGKAPFKNCIVLGHVNDKNGVKMSKHKGNVVDPWSVLDKQGADAVRWYFYTASAPWIPSRFYPEAVSEAQRRYMGPLWNSYAFFALYADIDKYDPSKYDLKTCKLTLMDKWILSKLNTLIKTVDRGLNEYAITESARALQEFVDVLSNWYVRRGRERYWGKEMTDDKAAAYTTLYTVLVTLAKLTAPFTPFVAEQMYRNLVPNFYKDAPKSVHMCDFPVCDEEAIDFELEKGMDSVLDIVVLGRAARNAGNLKNRQPLSEMVVATERELDLNDELKGIALDELNIKSMREAKDASALVTYKIKPQMKTLGPKYGKLLNGIRAFLETCDGQAVVSAVKGGGTFKTEIGGAEVELGEEDLLVSTESAEGYVSASDKGITVALNTALTPELVEEGVVRELISKLQTMRKEAGFEVTDRIRVYFVAGDKVADVLKKHGGVIAKTVLANSISQGTAEGYTKDWDFDGESVGLTVVKEPQ